MSVNETTQTIDALSDLVLETPNHFSYLSGVDGGAERITIGSGGKRHVPDYYENDLMRALYTHMEHTMNSRAKEM